MMIQTLSNTVRRLALLTAGATLLLAGGRANAAAASRQSVMVFPVTVSEGTPPGVAETALNAVRNAISQSNRYEVASFYARSPLVVRAIQTNAITREAAAGPFTPEAAAPIAKALGAQLAVTGSVEDYSYDADSHTASMTLSVQMSSAADGTSIGTAVASAQVSKPELNEASGQIAAANEAAGKTVSQILGVAATAVTPTTTLTPVPTNATTPVITGAIPTSTKKKGKSQNTLLIVGGVALLAILIGSGGGGGGGNGGGGNGGNPPPFPF